MQDPTRERVLDSSLRHVQNPRGADTRRLSLKLLVWLLLLGGCVSTPDREPLLQRGDQLAYPEAARAAGTSGWVKVRYDVSAAGRVENASVIAAVPALVFDAAALQAVSSWRFQPALRDGKPAAVEGLTSTLRFKLGETDDYPRR
ncbi:MAG: energy transducer TonB [Pseudomonadota bacterium]